MPPQQQLTREDRLRLMDELRQISRAEGLYESQEQKDAAYLRRLQISATLQGRPMPTALPGTMGEAEKMEYAAKFGRILGDWKIASANLNAEDLKTQRNAHTQQANLSMEMLTTAAHVIETAGGYKTESMKLESENLRSAQTYFSDIADTRGWQTWSRGAAAVGMEDLVHEWGKKVVNAPKGHPSGKTLVDPGSYEQLKVELRRLYQNDSISKTPSMAAFLHLLKTNYKYDLEKDIGHTPGNMMGQVEAQGEDTRTSLTGSLTAATDQKLRAGEHDKKAEAITQQLYEIVLSSEHELADSPLLQNIHPYLQKMYKQAPGEEPGDVTRRHLGLSESQLMGAGPTGAPGGVAASPQTRMPTSPGGVQPTGYDEIEQWLTDLRDSGKPEHVERRQALQSSPQYQQYVNTTYPGLPPQAQWGAVMDEARANRRAAAEGASGMLARRKAGTPGIPLRERMGAAAQGFRTGGRGEAGSAAFTQGAAGEDAPEATEARPVDEHAASRMQMAEYLEQPERKPSLLEGVPEATKYMTEGQQREFAGAQSLPPLEHEEYLQKYGEPMDPWPSGTTMPTGELPEGYADLDAEPTRREQRQMRREEPTPGLPDIAYMSQEGGDKPLVQPTYDALPAGATRAAASAEGSDARYSRLDGVVADLASQGLLPAGMSTNFSTTGWSPEEVAARVITAMTEYGVPQKLEAMPNGVGKWKELQDAVYNQAGQRSPEIPQSAWSPQFAGRDPAGPTPEERAAAARPPEAPPQVPGMTGMGDLGPSVGQSIEAQIDKDMAEYAEDEQARAGITPARDPLAFEGVPAEHLAESDPAWQGSQRVQDQHSITPGSRKEAHQYAIKSTDAPIEGWERAAPASQVIFQQNEALRRRNIQEMLARQDAAARTTLGQTEEAAPVFGERK